MQRETIREYRSEDRFVELFQDVFGPAAAAMLAPQYGYEDIEGHARFIDFVLESLLDRYAIEIDGETYHHPAVLTSSDYADHLVRQNSLVHLGWRILRWSDWQLQHESDRVKEHLSLLLETSVRLAIPQEHLPCKRGALVELFDHQEEALRSLSAMRLSGNQIALLSHAVGAGKTTTAVEDARSVGLRTLFLAHTHELVDQALARFEDLWPEAKRARLGDAQDAEAHVVVGTVQTMLSHISQFAAADFGYIVIDEAHHATARTYQAILRYFDPKFLLGLTGTPDRADGLTALEVFRQAAHRMDLETAVRQGVLCDVRCFRVVTNVDLANLRFNGAVYKQSDLERSIRIPERDALIVDTYCNNVKGKRAVAFCVSVAHAEEIARLFTLEGVSAFAVSGRLGREDRRKILDSYRDGSVQVLCACDVLNEGWDAPETEVLLMARPTLSKVLYQQQLGRGMRKHPGKDYLILFDFVDTFSRHNRALSLHRLLRSAKYKAGAKVFAGDDNVPTELSIHLWATDYELIDVFDWQERVEGMVTAQALSRMLRKSEDWVHRRWRAGEITADEIVELGGQSRVPYFALNRLPELRERFNIAEITDTELYDDFLRFMTDMDTVLSYKPVWFRAVLQHADTHGRALISEVNASFRHFYLDRARAGLVTEKSNSKSKLLMPEEVSATDAQHIINQGPFHRFSRLGFVGYARDRAYYEIHRNVWKRLSDPLESEKSRNLCDQAIAVYFRDLT